MSLSEVARLQEQIAREYEAATRGLSGLSIGSARHSFITAKMENIARCQKQLIDLTGEEKAMQHIIEALANM
jgi:hypothetical protein